jgi:hypothetical protein
MAAHQEPDPGRPPNKKGANYGEYRAKRSQSAQHDGSRHAADPETDSCDSSLDNGRQNNAEHDRFAHVPGGSKISLDASSYCAVENDLQVVQYLFSVAVHDEQRNGCECKFGRVAADIAKEIEYLAGSLFQPATSGSIF